MRTQKAKKVQNTPRPASVKPRRKREKKPAVPLPPVAPPPAAPVAHSDVRQRAMLVKLSIHRWPASATDSAITDEVAQTHGIADHMGKYQKNLLPKSALEKLRSAGSKLRARHNRLTLPWDEWSTRILSAKAFLEYNKVVREGIDEFDQIFADELEAVGQSGKTKYEEAKDEAAQLLGSAFRATDYPSLSILKRKFRASVMVMPIPDAADFRIDLGAEATQQVRAEIESRVNDQIEEAMRGLFGRLQGVVAKFVDALKADGIEEIRPTLFMAIENVLSVLPLLNVTGDAALDQFGDQIRGLIAGYGAKELRHEPSLRSAVLEQADAILAQMNDFLG